MSLNHLLLPASYPDLKLNIYRWLLWGRRILIGLIIGVVSGILCACFSVAAGSPCPFTSVGAGS